MCDTAVAVGNATADGAVIFAKNSDRHPDEAQKLVIVPRTSHPPGSMTRCTHVEIPSVPVTYAVLLCRPFWIWGAEMGANEHGVVIGNEAVHTRMPLSTAPGLIGMDFVRLGLERAETALGALQVITGLLAKHGQGGNCRHKGQGYYHNSFIIADPREAWVLETAGRHWAAERVQNVRSISNALTIGRTWDLASDGLVDEAIERGWCERREDFDFAACYADPDHDCTSGRTRHSRSSDLLAAARGRVDEVTATALLRDHGDAAGPNWSADSRELGPTICMHAQFEPVRGGQSVGSMVSRLTADGQLHWVTGTSAPCVSVFKPVWIDAGLPDLGPAPTDECDERALWWRHESLHRALERDSSRFDESCRAERDALESRFVADVPAMAAPSHQRLAYTAACFEEAELALDRWQERVRPASAV